MMHMHRRGQSGRIGAVADVVAMLAAFIGEYLRRYDNEDRKTR